MWESAEADAGSSRVCSRGWIWRPWKNLTGPVTRIRSPGRSERSSHGCPGHAQVMIPVSSPMTAWKIRSPDRVGTMPLLRTTPTAVTSMPTSTRFSGVMVDASS